VSRLRIALFGSCARFTREALAELSTDHEVVALVRAKQPAGIRGLLGSIRQPAACAELDAHARQLKVPVLGAAREDDSLRDRLAAVRPDLICIALHPYRVAAGVRAIAPLGAINVHPSLLPRHRGPLPLFWTYHSDDRRAGVTVHEASDALDAGDIVLQEGFELARGYPVLDLDEEVSRRGARLLRSAAELLARGAATRVPQDERAATYAPTVERNSAQVPFEEWDVERVWHFLAGMQQQHREPLQDERGRAVRYERIGPFRRGGSSLAPGRVQRDANHLWLHCRGGIVQLA
jgi:methionyl-tRNA formyltransferase